ncbi:hypothetical protein PHMEG_00035255 [Phytophthora megakarya]|uniref:Uncharacterized protein n=1 Tax=Phytophthora megakarya TaxID=4795 RepID=A0A225UPJ9_9STRA|nr:hypothetical protein PHMEG_00035255 [Phytophthora megakarya]
MKIIDEVGYENFLLEREDGEHKEQVVAHMSFLVTYRYPTELLRRGADDIAAQLEYEEQFDEEADVAPARAVVGATAVSSTAAKGRNGSKRRRAAMVGEEAMRGSDTRMVELR